MIDNPRDKGDYSDDKVTLYPTGGCYDAKAFVGLLLLLHELHRSTLP